MITRTIAAAILFSLAGSAAVLAEEPAVTVNPLAAEVAPAEVESTAQQAATETPSKVAVAVTGESEPQAAAEALADTTAVPVEPQVLSGTSAEVAAPATETVVAPSATASPAEAVAAGPVAAVTDTSRKPCAMKGMGRMGKGQGCKKKACDHQGKGRQGKNEQVVRRLDLIDARMAKIEAMLESLMQR